MPHYQINGQKLSTMNPVVEKADHSCIKLRGYLGKGIETGLWRETRFTSSNGVNMISFSLLIQHLLDYLLYAKTMLINVFSIFHPFGKLPSPISCTFSYSDHIHLPQK